jgi:xylulokinase
LRFKEDVAMLVLGIDVGDGRTSAVVTDESGTVVTAATSAHESVATENGWAEVDPIAWWDGVVASIRQVVKVLGSRTKEIRAVGLSGISDAPVLFDKMGQVIRPTLAGGPDLATKLAWVASHEPEAYARLAQILPAKDYIRYRMSGVYATDETQAEVAVGVPPAWLPKVYASDEVTSQVIPGIGALTGLPMWIPIVAGIGESETCGKAAAALAAKVVK